MKTFKSSIARSTLGLAVTVLATSLCLAAEGAFKEQPSKEKADAVEKKKSSVRRAAPQRVQVTGSLIEYKVDPGKKAPQTGLTVTVIDPNSPVNRGYASPIEALKRVPSVYSGR